MRPSLKKITLGVRPHDARPFRFRAGLVVAALLLAGGFASSLCAQPYAIDWFTLDGGGGTSTGSVYSVTGTIGQPDAGVTISGGSFSIAGGFWSLVSAIQTPGAPLLSIDRSGAGAVRLFWPVAAIDYQLDQSAAVGPGTLWGQVVAPYQTNGAIISVTVPAPAGRTFYRLRRN